MDITTLVSEVHEDCEPRIVMVSADANGDVVLRLEYDEWNDGAKTRRFDLRCEQPKAWDVTVGPFESLEYLDSHPLLMEHVGEQGRLFFSAVPASVERVFYVVHNILELELLGWIPASHFLAGSPEELIDRLKGGYGILAEGPISLLTQLASELKGILKVSIVCTHIARGPWKLLLVGHQRIICRAVSVTEVPARP